MNRPTWLLASAFLIVIAAGAQTATSSKSACTPPPTGNKEETYMLGRLFGAIEDLGGGYYKEAQGRYSGIVHDIEKKNYHSCLKWMAYDGYGETLTELKKKEKAVAMLTRAAELAKNLGEQEREQSAQHLQAAQNLK